MLKKILKTILQYFIAIVLSLVIALLLRILRWISIPSPVILWSPPYNRAISLW